MHLATVTYALGNVVTFWLEDDGNVRRNRAGIVDPAREACELKEKRREYAWDAVVEEQSDFAIKRLEWAAACPKT